MNDTVIFNLQPLIFNFRLYAAKAHLAQKFLCLVCAIAVKNISVHYRLSTPEIAVAKLFCREDAWCTLKSWSVKDSYSRHI